MQHAESESAFLTGSKWLVRSFRFEKCLQVSGLRWALWKVWELWNWEHKSRGQRWGVEFGEEGEVWGLTVCLSPGLPYQSLWQGLALCPLWVKSLWCPQSCLLGSQVSSGANIVWVVTAANSTSPPSYDGLKEPREIILVMLWLRVVRSLNQMSDNLMILIEEAVEVGG